MIPTLVDSKEGPGCLGLSLQITCKHSIFFVGIEAVLRFWRAELAARLRRVRSDAVASGTRVPADCVDQAGRWMNFRAVGRKIGLRDAVSYFGRRLQRVRA